MKALGRALGWLVTASSVVGAVAVFLMMIQIFIDVILKSLFGTSVPATTIFVAHYYMVIVAYLPIALAERMNAHITVDLLVQHFSRRFRLWLTAAIWLLSAVVAGAIALRLWGEAVTKYEFGSFMIERDIPIAIWPGYFVLPIGFGLFALVLLYRFACAVSGAASGLGEVSAESESTHATTKGME